MHNTNSTQTFGVGIYFNEDYELLEDTMDYPEYSKKINGLTKAEKELENMAKPHQVHMLSADDGSWYIVGEQEKVKIFVEKAIQIFAINDIPVYLGPVQPEFDY